MGYLSRVWTADVNATLWWCVAPSCCKKERSVRAEAALSCSMHGWNKHTESRMFKRAQRCKWIRWTQQFCSKRAAAERFSAANCNLGCGFHINISVPAVARLYLHRLAACAVLLMSFHPAGFCLVYWFKNVETCHVMSTVWENESKNKHKQAHKHAQTHVRM